MVLQHANLRRHLQRYLAGELKIVQLLFKAVALIGQILGGLGVHRVAGFGSLGAQLFQIALADFLQPHFAGHDIHGQLAKVGQVHLVQAVEHRHILQQLNLMLLKRGRDGLDILRYRIVARLHGGQLRLGVEEQPAQALGLLGRAFKALELGDQVGQDIPHLA